MKRIAVMMGGLVFDSQRKILEGIYQEMDRCKVDVCTFTCHAITTNSPEILKGAHQIYQLPDFDNFDGVIVAPNTLADQDTVEWIFREIQRTGVPAVYMDHEYQGVASIMSDNYQGMYELVEHLITVHGKRKFYYLSGPVENRDSVQRRQGFLDVLQKYQIPYESNQIFDGSFAPESGKRAWDYWMKEIGVLPEAFVCANDAMAQGIIIELSIRGIRVPEDVLVTGVDNGQEASGCEPRMTTIDRNYFMMGVEACRLLQEAEQGKDISEVQLQLPSQVIYGQSCGCPEQHCQDVHELKRSKMVNDFYTQEIASVIKDMISDYSGVNTFEEVVEVLRRYVPWTDAQNFYLCINDMNMLFPRNISLEQGKEDTIGEMQKFSQYMTIPLAYEDGVFSSYGNFPSKEVLPRNIKCSRKFMHHIFVPLHYQDEMFGYCVFSNSNFPVDRELCYTWVLAISGAIQNVRKNQMLHETIKRLNEVWVYDPLTGLYNRAGFFHLAKNVLENAKREQRGIYLTFLDLDGLKLINDTYGHEAGDRFIKEMAQILKKVSLEGELVMRYGGDEFAVMGPFQEYNRAEEMMREIEAELTLANRNTDRQYVMSASMGYQSFAPWESVNLETILEQADQNMYKQKRRRKEQEQR